MVIVLQTSRHTRRARPLLNRPRYRLLAPPRASSCPSTLQRAPLLLATRRSEAAITRLSSPYPHPRATDHIQTAPHPHPHRYARSRLSPVFPPHGRMPTRALPMLLLESPRGGLPITRAAAIRATAREGWKQYPCSIQAASRIQPGVAASLIRGLHPRLATRRNAGDAMRRDRVRHPCKSRVGDARACCGAAAATEGGSVGRCPMVGPAPPAVAPTSGRAVAESVWSLGTLGVALAARASVLCDGGTVDIRGAHHGPVRLVCVRRSVRPAWLAVGHTNQRALADVTLRRQSRI